MTTGIHFELAMRQLGWRRMSNTVLLIIFILLTTLVWSLQAAEIYQGTALPSDEVLEQNLSRYQDSLSIADPSGRGGKRTFSCKLVGKRPLANNEYEVYFTTDNRDYYISRLVKLIGRYF